MKILKKGKRGFSLYELLLAACILAVTLATLLGLYLTCLELNEINRKKTLAISDLKSKMEEIKNTPFANLSTTSSGGTFNNTETFQLASFPAGEAIGRIEIQYVLGDSFGYLMKSVRLVASFRAGRRVIGEDKNLNGALDGGEDTSGNSLLNGPVELETYITQ